MGISSMPLQRLSFTPGFDRPILPDERRADGRRELRRPRILKQGRRQVDHIFLTDGIKKQRIYSR